MGDVLEVIFVRVGVAAVALAVVASMLMSAVKTFVVPRAEPTALTRSVFRMLRVPFFALAKRRGRVAGHRTMRLFAPVALLALPAVWLLVTWLSFGVFFYLMDDSGWRNALEISGASLTSVGTFRPAGFGATVVSFVETSLGLGLVALLITYLPTIYAAYQRREREVSLLTVRAGSPPSAVEMLVRFQIIGLLGETEELFAGWEDWFVDLEESHTSLGSLAYFRSGPHEHSWVTASGAVLDGAALMLSLVDVEREPRAALCIRSGFLALRAVADFYGIRYDPNPRPGDPISITRAEFDDAARELAAAGVPLKTDLDSAWVAFAGWRVNYDTVLVALADLVWAPPARWSGSR